MESLVIFRNLAQNGDDNENENSWGELPISKMETI